MGSDLAELARQRDLAWAEAFMGLSRVTATLASRLRQMHVEPSATTGMSTAAGPPVELRPGRLPRGGYGPRQREVLALGGLDQPAGMTTAEVSTAVVMKLTNAHTLLAGLEKHGVLERFPDERPVRWRRALA